MKDVVLSIACQRIICSGCNNCDWNYVCVEVCFWSYYSICWPCLKYIFSIICPIVQFMTAAIQMLKTNWIYQSVHLEFIGFSTYNHFYVNYEAFINEQQWTYASWFNCSKLQALLSSKRYYQYKLFQQKLHLSTNWITPVKINLKYFNGCNKKMLWEFCLNFFFILKFSQCNSFWMSTRYNLFENIKNFFLIFFWVK